MLGLGLCVGGALFAPVAYFLVGSVPLAAVGLSSVIIGFTSLMLAGSRPYISPEACDLILRTGLENTSALLEELGLVNKAVYLPSRLRDGRPQALIPLADEREFSMARNKLPGRLIVRYGPDSDDMAIAVSTPGSLDLGNLPAPPGPTAAEIESALTYLLVGMLDIVDSVSVSLAGGEVEIGVAGARLRSQDIWYYRCLGSPVASIAAAVCAEALDRPVRVKEETDGKGKSRVILEVLA